MNRAVLAAVGLSLSGIFLLDLMGVLIRILSAQFTPAELAIYRNLFGMVPCFALVAWAARRERQRFFIRQWPLAFFRGFCVTFAQVCYYLALARLEFATTSTLAFCSPMIVTCLSALLLKDPVGAWRWGAVLVGFAGVVMVMNPGSDVFTWYAALPVGAAFGYALSIVLVRRMDEDVSTAIMILYSAVSALIGAVFVTFATGGFTPVADAGDWFWLAAMGLVGGTGVILLVAAYRLVSPSILAPFDYFGILFAFVMGWLIFDEAPFDRLFPGVIFIVGGGLIIVWRERQLKRLKATPLPET